MKYPLHRLQVKYSFSCTMGIRLVWCIMIPASCVKKDHKPRSAIHIGMTNLQPWPTNQTLLRITPFGSANCAAFLPHQLRRNAIARTANYCCLTKMFTLAKLDRLTVKIITTLDLTDTNPLPSSMASSFDYYRYNRKPTLVHSIGDIFISRKRQLYRYNWRSTLIIFTFWWPQLRCQQD